MELKLFGFFKRYVELKMNQYSNNIEKNYACLIFVTFIKKMFISEKRPSAKIFAILSCIFFQLVTVPVLLQLLFVSTKNVKVLFSQMFEALYCFAVSIEFIFLLISHHRRTKLLRSFDCVFIKNHKFIKKILYIELIASTIIAGVLITVMVLWFSHSTWTPISEEQLALTPRKYPTRSFKTELLLPFDYSISPYYEVVWFVLLYYGITLQSVVFETVTTMPFITLHIKGQLDIIAYFLRSIGNNDFIYANISRADKIPMQGTPNSVLNGPEKTALTKKLIVEVIKHHQKVLRIINTYERRSQLVFGLRLLVSIVLMLTNLCQLKFTEDNRVYVFANTFMIFQFNYFLCTGSELIDSGVANVHRAAYQNLWYTCSPETWKLLQPLLLISQKPRHFKFMRFYIIDNRSFLTSLRLTYSLFLLLIKFS